MTAALVAGQAWVQPTTGGASTPPALAAPIPRSVWLYEPDPAAMPTINFRLDEVLDQVNPVNRLVMADSEIRIHVIPEDWKLTDLPPWKHLKGDRLPDPNPNDGYNESRSYDQIRGLGPPYCVDGPLDIAIGEELLVPRPPSDRPGATGQDVGKIMVHEVAHGVECSLTPAQATRLGEIHRAAVDRFPRGIVGDNTTYAASTRREYFAEGVVAWFEAARGPTYRRAWLKQNDTALHDLISQVFAVPPPTPRCDGRRATLVLKDGSGPITGTPGADVIVGTPGDDIVNGGGGDDVVCGGDGHDSLRGGYGADKLLAGPGDDTVDGGAGPDTLAGEDGADELTDHAGRNRLQGGPGDDRLDATDDDRDGDWVEGGDGGDDCRSDADDEVTSCNEPAPPPTTSTPSTPTTTPPVTSPATTVAPPVTTVPPVVTVPDDPPGTGTDGAGGGVDPVTGGGPPPGTAVQPAPPHDHPAAVPLA